MFVIDWHMARYLRKTYCVRKCKKKWISRIWSWRYFNERDFFLDSITLWGKGCITWRLHVYRGNKAYPNDVIAAMLVYQAKFAWLLHTWELHIKIFPLELSVALGVFFYNRPCLLAIKIAILAWHVWPPYSFYMSFQYITGSDNSVKCLWMMINNSC